MPRQGTIIRQVQIEDQSWPKKAKVETKTQTKTNNKGLHRARDQDQPKPTKRNMTSGKDKPFHIIYYLYFITYQKMRPLKWHNVALRGIWEKANKEEFYSSSPSSHFFHLSSVCLTFALCLVLCCAGTTSVCSFDIRYSPDYLVLHYLQCIRHEGLQITWYYQVPWANPVQE